jgi:hypothetical protein
MSKFNIGDSVYLLLQTGTFGSDNVDYVSHVGHYYLSGKNHISEIIYRNNEVCYRTKEHGDIDNNKIFNSEEEAMDGLKIIQLKQRLVLIKKTTEEALESFNLI